MDVAYLGRNDRLDFRPVRDKNNSARISRPLLRFDVWTAFAFFPNFLFHPLVPVVPARATDYEEASSLLVK